MPRQLNKSKCFKIAASCKSRGDLKSKDASVYTVSLRNGWLDEFASNLGWPAKRQNWSYISCHNAASKCTSRRDFRRQHPGAYSKSLSESWMYEFANKFNWPNPEFRKLTKEYCFEVASQCHSKSHLCHVDHAVYHKSRVKGWLPEFSKKLGWLIETGFTKSQFVAACDRNNGGIGIFYALHCHDDYENFIKIGITSQSVRRRYRKNRDLPYEYNILFCVYAPGDLIYQLEKDSIKSLRDYRYTPIRWRYPRSYECFNLEGFETLKSLYFGSSPF